MSDDDDDDLYVILCFTQGGRQSVVETGLTLEEAQEHCRRNDTRGDNWFHGYGLESDWPSLIKQYELEQERY